MSRKLKNLLERDKFYILTNGQKTEKNYFDLIKSKHSIYDVEVKYCNSDPLQLVQHAQNYTLKANQVWCVFDIDNSYEEGNLVNALDFAKKNNINIAFSNLAFEVWLISHFKKCNCVMGTKQHLKELNAIIKNDLSLQKKIYSKSDKKLLENYFIPRYGQAVNNSKVVHQNFIKKHNENFHNENYKIWEWNSCSNVYELIEALHLSDPGDNV